VSDCCGLPNSSDSLTSRSITVSHSVVFTLSITHNRKLQKSSAFVWPTFFINHFTNSHSSSSANGACGSIPSIFCSSRIFSNLVFSVPNVSSTRPGYSCVYLPTCGASSFATSSPVLAWIAVWMMPPGQLATVNALDQE
jgi:hypothetical protein